MGTGVSPKRIATSNSLLLIAFASTTQQQNNLHPLTNLMLRFRSHSLSVRMGFRTNLALRFRSGSLSAQCLLIFPRKEVIQPHLPIRLPCYDFTPVTNPAFGSSLLSVGSLTSGVIDSHGVTGGVYKTRERIHRDILIRDY